MIYGLRFDPVEYASTAPAPGNLRPGCGKSMPSKATTPTKPLTSPTHIDLICAPTLFYNCSDHFNT